MPNIIASIDIFALAAFVGTVAFALSGFLIGVRKELDWMGIFILAMLTANGGGAVRDILVGRLPVVLSDISGFLIVLAVMILGMVLRLHKYVSLERSHLFILSDSLGLVAFSVTGALVGLEAGLSIFGVMVLAFITATGGGIIRDLMVNDVPAVLSSDFYGTIAVLLGAAIYGLHWLEWDNNITLSALFICALALRLLAYYKRWQLPRMQQHRG